MPDPITATAVATGVLTMISQNDAVKKLGSDFVTTITGTVRSWLLIDDDPVTETAVKEMESVSEDQALSPLAQQVLMPKLTAYLEQHPDALSQLHGLLQRGQQQQLKGGTVNQSINHTYNEGATIGTQMFDTKIEGGMTINQSELPKE